MSLDDDRWSLAHLRRSNLWDEYGASTYRFCDAYGVVHRAECSSGVWRMLCGDFVPEEIRRSTEARLTGDEMLTCLSCIGKGG